MSNLSRANKAPINQVFAEENFRNIFFNLMQDIDTVKEIIIYWWSHDNNILNIVFKHNEVSYDATIKVVESSTLELIEFTEAN